MFRGILLRSVLLQSTTFWALVLAPGPTVGAAPESTVSPPRVELRGNPRVREPGTTPQRLSDSALIREVQHRTFRYFWDGAEPHSGAARERFHVDGDYPDHDAHIVTSGGTGFGVMALLVGIERGFITRTEGAERLTRIVGFLEKADRFHGAWPHWMEGPTGRVKPFSRNDNGGDLVESAFLVQGLLCVRQYFRDGSPAEQALAKRIDRLWRSVEWDWYQRGGQNVLYWHWSPDKGWAMNFRIEGYNECLITYVLAASSPTHPIPAAAYHEGWARGGRIKNNIDPKKPGPQLELNHQGDSRSGGPLFWSHYSFLGLDPRRLHDRYADYWRHNVEHTRINRQHCIENPHGYRGYGPHCWGLTAGYSVGFYAAHRPGEDLGVISPTAALSSFPYTPRESLRALRYFHDDLGHWIYGPYGFYDGFSLHHRWCKPWYLAIDQGPIVVMMENHRTGLLWRLFMSCPEVQTGLDRLGFRN
jgi:hypothetical protein